MEVKMYHFLCGAYTYACMKVGIQVCEVHADMCVICRYVISVVHADTCA
jgi:hypothetical protein